MVSSTGALIERAHTRTGLTEFGDDPWRTGFERLLDAVDEEVPDPEATARIEGIVVERLVQRLRIEAWYRDHAGDGAHPLEGVVVIFGLPRTATTAVHHLLTVDDRFRYLRSWELADPVPPPDAATEAEDPRRPTEVTADVRHIVTIDGPAEDWPIHALAFDHAELTLPVDSYSTWWRDRDHSGLLAYHERVLRLLHAHRPPRTWLLKMPAYVFLLEEFVAHYPDARFVMMHRDPVTVLASTCSTVAAARRKRTPSWSPGPGFGHDQLEHWAEGMRRAMAARTSLGEDRFMDVAQRDLEADPLGTAERVYAHAGYTLDGATVQAMQRWADANRRGTRGAHQYRLDEYGLSPTEVANAFGPYLDWFGDLCGPG